jgi:hypothetical protein
MRKALLIVWIFVLIHIILVNQLLAAKVAAAPSAYSIDRVLDMRGCVQEKKPNLALWVCDCPRTFVWI